ncbi:leucine-rich repeat-containing protein 53-like [Leucoraja erinacea]|uniref:leucine-rich repeat-containing protein 53-like n=1 Tax=Leucoraja erinaceus TaxID=7782 RepID=UPI0024540568|nr:leucine-rich repeat-containing protein 53-like [Leucoraja erinacea]
MFQMPQATVRTRNPNLLLSVLNAWSLLHSTCEASDPCVNVNNNVYLCTVIPHASLYPSNVKHLLFKVGSGIGPINSTMFNSSSLSSVTNLTIVDSDVTSIEQGAFNSFLSVAVLILDNNKLSTISASWFTSPARLVKLSLVRNRICTIDVTTLSNFTNLAELDLSQNMIRTIADHSFRNNLKLSFLNLANNNLTLLRIQTFVDFHPKRLGLQGNPWCCSCELADFAIFLRGNLF